MYCYHFITNLPKVINKNSRAIIATHRKYALFPIKSFYYIHSFKFVKSFV